MLSSYVSLGMILLAAGALTAGVAVILMARGLLRPPRMTDGKAVYRLGRLSPADLGLAFEDAAWTVCDARTGLPLRIAGWWIPAGPSPIETGRCAILLHGYGDAKIGAITWAPVLHELGFHILAIDLRGHGESGGTDTTAGYFEREDVSQVIDQIRAERPAQTRQIVLFGVSLGAAVAAATAVLRKPMGDIAAVIMDSPFADYRRAAAARIGQIGLPSGVIAHAAIRLAEALAGSDFSVVRPLDLIPRIPCPLLVIVSPDDGICVTPDEAGAIASAVQSRPPDRGPSICHLLPGVPHLHAIIEDLSGYRMYLNQFCHAALTPDNLQEPLIQQAGLKVIEPP